MFIGPPYNTAPLSNIYDYTLSSLWFNVSEYHAWLPREFQWTFGPEGCQVAPWGQHYWFPEAVIAPQHMHQVRRRQEICRLFNELPCVDLNTRFVCRGRALARNFIPP